MNFQQVCLIWILPFQVVVVLSLNDIFNVKQNCQMYKFTTIICRDVDLHNKQLNFEQLNGTFKLYLIQTNLQTLEENMFNGTKLEYLSVSDNPLTMIDKHAFNGQEEFLKTLKLSTTNTSVHVDFTALQNLYNLETLEIEKFKMNENLNNFTSNKLNKLKKLTLIENGIHDIFVNVFESLGNLTELVVKQNQLEKLLHPQAFAYLHNIEFLDLSNNAIQEIAEGTLQNIESRLKLFNVSYNKITEDHLKHFKNLSELESLILDDNLIKRLTEDIFKNMNQLKTLSVKSNQLTKLHRTHLNGLNNLKELYLNDNELLIENSSMAALPLLEILYVDNQKLKETMKMDWLGNASGQLKKLSLRGNSLNAKQLWVSIKTLAQLEELDLSKCQLKEIPVFAFEHNTKLKLLKLNNNELETLREGTFEGLQDSLESIQLRSNQLQLVDKCVFNNFSWSQREYFNIDLFNNKLQCNCSLEWLQIQLKEFIKRYNDTMLSVQYWNCFNTNATEKIVDATLNCQSNNTKTMCEDYEWRYTTQAITVIPLMFSSLKDDSQKQTNLATTSITTRSIATTTVKSFERPKITISLQRQRSNVVKIEWKISDLFWVKDFTLNINEIFSNQTRKIYNLPIHLLRRSQIYHYLSNQSILHICIIVNVKVASNLIDACETLQPKEKSTNSPKTSNKNTLEIALGSAVAVALFILAVLLFILYMRRKNNNKKKHTYEEPKSAATTSQVDAVTPKKYQERRKPDESKSPTVTVISGGQFQPERPISTGSYQYLDNPNFQSEHTYEDVNAEDLSDESSMKDDKRVSLQNLSVDHFRRKDEIHNYVNRPLPCPPETHSHGNNNNNNNNNFYINVPKYFDEAKETKI